MDDHRRAHRYERIHEQLRSLIEGRSPDATAAMATICAVLHAKMPHHSWTGFYRVVSNDELRVGPYQGPVACQLLKGGGVCLDAARARRAVIAPDVRSYPGHIACDPRSRSEIAVPVVGSGRVVAILDIDSHEAAQFGPSDVEPLERIVSLLYPLFSSADRMDVRS